MYFLANTFGRMCRHFRNILLDLAFVVFLIYIHQLHSCIPVKNYFTFLNSSFSTFDNFLRSFSGHIFIFQLNNYPPKYSHQKSMTLFILEIINTILFVPLRTGEQMVNAAQSFACINSVMNSLNNFCK